MNHISDSQGGKPANGSGNPTNNNIIAPTSSSTTESIATISTTQSSDELLLHDQGIAKKNTMNDYVLDTTQALQHGVHFAHANNNTTKAIG